MEQLPTPPTNKKLNTINQKQSKKFLKKCETPLEFKKIKIPITHSVN